MEYFRNSDAGRTYDLVRAIGNPDALMEQEELTKLFKEKLTGDEIVQKRMETQNQDTPP